MSIAFKKYVDITSAVAASTFANKRELIGRMITDNVLLPTSSFIEFTDSNSVGDYFGTQSLEYKRAVYYFSFVSKNITSPNKLSYWRWTSVNSAPRIYGKKITAPISQFQAVIDGSFVLNIGPDSNQIGSTSMNFSTALSYADVASIIQTAIHAETGTGTMWTGATFVYNNLDNRFEFTGGASVTAAISVTGPGTPVFNILPLIGFDTGAIFSDGLISESITDTLINCDSASNNFGSFLFVPPLTLDEITEAAIWNDSLNNLYQYYTYVTLSNYSAYSAALIGYGGTGITLLAQGITGEYPEQLPMNILASTDYNSANAVQNYMFQISNLTPSVSDTALSNALDALRVNYYGNTQQAGNQINFYQRGVLCGTGSDAIDMNVYANEQWLKDAAGAQIMSLFLALTEIPANAKGKLIILGGIQAVIDQALLNGVISVGKALNITQQLFISQVSGDNNAWHQVQNIGYWIDCKILLVGLEYQAVYVLIYTKDDAIRKVSGSHILV